jgi:glycosyltransferase involved in cell wall biosynthesis
MKIMLLVPKLMWEGGGDRQVLMLAANLQQRGHKVVIFTTRYDSQNCFPEISKNLDIRTIGTSGNGKDARKMAKIICKIMDEKKESFDVVNCHIHPMQWVASYLKKMKNIPVVWMCNDLPAWFLPFLTKGEINWNKKMLYKTIFPLIDHFLVKRINAIIVFNKKEQQKVKDYYNKDAYIISSGLDIESFSNGHRDEIRKQYGIEQNAVLLLCVSLLGPRRRTEDVITSLKILRSKGYNVKLIVIGGESHYPGYSEVLRQYAKEKGVLENVILAGSVREKQLPDYYAACDIFVYPHINQTWGLAPLEAMAARKPTIVSIDTGVSEVLIDYQTTLLVNPNDPEQLNEKIAKLISDDKLRAKLITQGYNFVKEKISWDKYTEEMLYVFKDVVNR